MTAEDGAGAGSLHPRWAMTEEHAEFFSDEDELRLRFRWLLAASIALLSGLCAGLWLLRRRAAAPPVFVGIAGGWIFTGDPAGLETVAASDFDRQLRETVEVAFRRTERGTVPALADFCAPGVLEDVGRAFRDVERRYPAGFAQALRVLDQRVVRDGAGYREVRYRGLLSSRSAAAAQTSPVYLDCVFAIGAPTRLNSTGWRLRRIAAIGGDAYYAPEREKAFRDSLGLPPKHD